MIKESNINGPDKFYKPYKDKYCHDFDFVTNSTEICHVVMNVTNFNKKLQDDT